MAKDTRKDYRPKIGDPFSIDVEIEKVRHRHKIELIVLGVGVFIVAVFLFFIYIELPITGIRGVWMSAILAMGVASLAIGIAGTLDVEYRGSNLVAKGGLGLGAFLLVFLVSTLLYWRQ